MAAVVHYCNFADQRVGTPSAQAMRQAVRSTSADSSLRVLMTGYTTAAAIRQYGSRPGGRKSHRDLVADGRPVGARQAFGNKDHIAHRDVIDDAWPKIPATEFVMGFVEKWDELIDWEARTSLRKMARPSLSLLPSPPWIPQRSRWSGEWLESPAGPVAICQRRRLDRGGLVQQHTQGDMRFQACQCSACPRLPQIYRGRRRLIMR